MAPTGTQGHAGSVGHNIAHPVPTFTREEEIKAYREMLLIRRFEERAGQLYGMGLIGGFCHLYIGQEAVVVGLQMAAKPGDQVITTYRDHGHMLATGMDAKGVMAELTGRRGGYSRGKGGSMHMFSKEKHFYGGHGIVGASVPLGAGLAFANKYRGNNNLCWCYFGDGAANQGQVYETFNMAKLWSLPIVFVIEHNGYAQSTPAALQIAGEVAARPRAFGIATEECRSAAAEDIAHHAASAIDAARGGRGPQCLVCYTYRLGPHSKGDDTRSEAELRDAWQRDPLKAARAGLDEATAVAIEQQVGAQIAAARAHAVEAAS